MIGITGSIGTGKSTVAAMMIKRGAKLIDADKIAREETKKGGACFQKIIQRFGKVVLNKGEIDRLKLGQIVFQEPDQLKKLMSIIHPVVRKVTKEKINQYKRKDKKAVIVLDVPLLFEDGFDRYADWTVVVKSKEKQLLQRASARLKISQQQVKERIRYQMPLLEKVRRADFVIDNSGTKKQTEKQVERIWQKLQQEKRS